MEVAEITYYLQTGVEILVIGFVVGLIVFFSRNHRAYRKVKKQYKNKMKELEENKCKDRHDWVSMNVDGKECHVCQKCYWCPDHKGFVKKLFVKAHLEHLKFKEKLEEYRKERIKEIAEKHSLNEDVVKEIIEQAVSIEKDFTIKHINEKIEELKKDD